MGGVEGGRVGSSVGTSVTKRGLLVSVFPTVSNFFVADYSFSSARLGVILIDATARTFYSHYNGGAARAHN